MSARPAVARSGIACMLESVHVWQRWEGGGRLLRRPGSARTAEIGGVRVYCGDQGPRAWRRLGGPCLLRRPGSARMWWRGGVCACWRPIHTWRALHLPAAPFAAVVWHALLNVHHRRAADGAGAAVSPSAQQPRHAVGARASCGCERAVQVGRHAR
eukprot:363769-Chlamydomonas_euryale.AAC.14